MTTPCLADVVAAFDRWYPPESAESWDAVGLVAGDPDQPVAKVLFAIDPAPDVAQEAADLGADLLVVHHPLFLRPVHGVAATTAKGRTLATLQRAGCALLTAHTNADSAAGGVSEALAYAIGLHDLRPIIPDPAVPADTLVTFVPTEQAEQVRRALADAGAGALGRYDHASFSARGQGRFRPLAGASPAVGAVGVEEVVEEERIEVMLPRRLRSAVVRALLAAHPYEEPAWDLVERADAGLQDTGTGRVGEIAPTTLGAFADAVAAALPATAAGIRVAGDADRPVRRVGVCGGAGDFLLDRMATSDVDVFLTSDLRHHRAAEFTESSGVALIDVPHWAAEWTWLPVVAQRVEQAWGDRLSTRVSTVCTDPWTSRR